MTYEEYCEYAKSCSDIRQMLRTFYEEAELAETDGEREQLITKVVEQIQACRFCAFEKEQREKSDALHLEEVQVLEDMIGGLEDRQESQRGLKPGDE